MIQLFQIGEVAMLQSVEAPMYMWNMHVTVLSAKWMDKPTDIHGLLMAPTYVYEIDALDGFYIQSTLRKIGNEAIEISIKETVRELEPA